MKTSIIIVNFNGGELLEKCILSVLKTKLVDFEIILIDNASIDSSHLKCKEKFPTINLIENKENLGFCRGNNVGIKKAKGDYIVFLNPDTEVEPDWLIKLIDAYANLGECLLQPKILQADSKSIINSTGGSINIFAIPFLRGNGTKDIGQYENIEQIGYCSGACLFLSRKTLDKLGYFDPYLFAYYEDTSLSWKAAMLEIKSYYIPNSVVYHHVGSNSFSNFNEKKHYLLQRNRWYSLLTHYSRGTFYKILPSLILFEVFFYIYHLGFNRIKSKVVFRALKDLIKDRKLINERYQELEKIKKISDKEIICNFMEMSKNSIKNNRKKKAVAVRTMGVLNKLNHMVL